MVSVILPLNLISIFKITLKDGVIEVLSIETRSALPIEEKSAMAMAVIPRSGVMFIQVFMTLAGKTAGPTPDGFGAEYEASFFVSQLVQVFPQGNCKSDLIYVDSPLPGSRVASPLRIRGHARGKWFFEGDFPVALVDADGKIIAQGYATAKNGWMTEMFVPFESVIKFKKPRL